MGYFLILVFFSSNFLYSLKNVLKAFTPLLFFGVAVTFVNDYRDFNKLLKSMIILSILFIANMIISNLLDLGGGKYTEEETEYLQTGSIYSEGLNSMGYYLVLIPAIIQLYPFKSFFRKLLVVLSSVVIFIILLIVMKRGALVVVLIGYTVMIYFAEIRQKQKLIKIALFLLTLLVLAYPVYKDILLSRFDVREERFQLDSYETEGRFTENTIVLNDLFNSGNAIWMLFGHEVLNSSGNYGGGIYGQRQLHNDYAQVLNGSGITGLGLYLFMNFSILAFYLRLKNRIIALGMYSRTEKILNVVFWAYFIAFFALAFSGGIDSLVYNPIRFIFLGAIIGVFKNIPLIRMNPANQFASRPENTQVVT
jgi:hypothetical protein